jgi:hypothetical protein
VRDGWHRDRCVTFEPEALVLAARSLTAFKKSGLARLEFAAAGPAPCGVLRLNGTQVPRAISYYVRTGLQEVNGQFQERAMRSPAYA